MEHKQIKNFWGIFSLIILNPHRSKDQADTRWELLSAWCLAMRNSAVTQYVLLPPPWPNSHPPMPAFSPGPLNPAAQASPLRRFQPPWLTLRLLLVSH